MNLAMGHARLETDNIDDTLCFEESLVAPTSYQLGFCLRPTSQAAM
jgi:hypothetical protein